MAYAETLFFCEWRQRRESGAADWFVDRSRAPLHCPHATDPALADAVIALRRRFPHLGPRKLVWKLKREAPAAPWPAASTIGDILKQAGLITPVKKRRPALDQQKAMPPVAGANDEWAADFKGWFRTRDDGNYPLHVPFRMM